MNFKSGAGFLQVRMEVFCFVGSNLTKPKRGKTGSPICSVSEFFGIDSMTLCCCRFMLARPFMMKVRTQ